MTPLAGRLVSGAPDRIYASPESLLEYRDAVMDGSRAAAAGIHFLFELYPAAYYSHVPNPDMIVDEAHPWGAALLGHHHAEKHCHAAASVVLRIDDAVIDGAVIHCGPGDDAPILYESYRFPERIADPLAAGAHDDVPLARVRRLGRPCLYLGSVGSFNYGHWLVDDLPRAKAWMELRRRLPLAPILVMPSHAAAIDAIRLQSLRLMIDRRIRVRFVPHDRPCRLRNFHYATPVSHHPRTKNPAAIHFLRTRAAARLPGEGTRGRKLFVARRPPNSRAIVNFDALWSFLKGIGFELVEPEKLGFAAQVALFREARIVVGQMGAGMTNSLFCRPATNLIYLAPVGWPEPFYLDLAAVGGQQYHILPGPPAQDGPPHLVDFTVPVDLLRRRLAFMGFVPATG